MENSTNLLKLKMEINSLENALIARCRGIKVEAFKQTLRAHAELNHRLKTIKASMDI